MVVQIDEMLDSKELVLESDAEALLRELRSLLNPVADGEEFGAKYRVLLQEDPDIILKHGQIGNLL